MGKNQKCPVFFLTHRVHTHTSPFQTHRVIDAAVLPSGAYCNNSTRGAQTSIKAQQYLPVHNFIMSSSYRQIILLS